MVSALKLALIFNFSIICFLSSLFTLKFIFPLKFSFKIKSFEKISLKNILFLKKLFNFKLDKEEFMSKLNGSRKTSPENVSFSLPIKELSDRNFITLFFKS